MKNYFPSPISGQTFPGYLKVSASQIRKLLAAGKIATGFMVGNKVNSFHFFGGWHLAHTFEFSTVEDFDRHLNSALFYLEPELGSRMALYVRKPYKPRPFTLWTTRKFLTA